VAEVKYQLYVITSSGGFYPALTATPPSDDYHTVSRLEEAVQRLRPGFGKHYITVIARHDDLGELNEEDLAFMKKEAEILLELTSY
jgi:hypothetical protein